MNQKMTFTQHPAEAGKTYPFTPPAKDRSIFWSMGGEIWGNEPPSIVSINREMGYLYASIQNSLLGVDGGSKDSYLDLSSVCRGRFNGRLQDPDLRLVSAKTSEGEYFTFGLGDFWRELSLRFAAEANGAVTTLVHKSYAKSNFRMFEYTQLMQNSRVNEVVPVHGVCYLDKIAVLNTESGKLIVLNKDEFHKRRQDFEDVAKYQRFHTPSVPDSSTKQMDKHDWSLYIKRHWLEFILEKVERHACFNFKKRLPGREESEVFYAVNVDRADSSPAAVQVVFLLEVDFLIKEYLRTKDKFDLDLLKSCYKAIKRSDVRVDLDTINDRTLSDLSEYFLLKDFHLPDHTRQQIGLSTNSYNKKYYNPSEARNYSHKKVATVWKDLHELCR